MALRAAPDPAALPVPPSNTDAEENILGACMLTPAAIDAVQPIVQPNDFYRASHGRIYRAILDLRRAGAPVDAITVAEELTRHNDLEDVGGKQRLNELTDLTPAASNAPHYARIVADLSELRDQIQLGERISQLAWDRDADTDQLRARALELVQAHQERRHTTELTVESWETFEQSAHDRIPFLIEGLWTEAGFGFIAAPPKKGKTWVGLALALAVATGRPLFGRYEIPAARPVLYVALEGHRAALRARIGALARGQGLNPDPDSGDLQNLHLLYKPRGINLSELTWAHRLARAAATLDARLVVIDVLRAAARIKENAQEEFTALRHNLQPISDDGRAIAMLHHNVKLSEISRDRDPGERMSGSGAMYGALDAGIYITGSENHATKLRLDFDLRDDATQNHINIQLVGEPTGEHGGYTYRDAAQWIVLDPGSVDEDDLKAPPQEIAAYVDQEGGDVSAKTIRSYFEISDHTLTKRLGRLAQIGIDYTAGPGKPGRLTRRPEAPATVEQKTLDSYLTSEQPPKPNTPNSDDFGGLPHNKAKKTPKPNTTEVDAVRYSESADLQGKNSSEVPPPLKGCAPAPAGTHTPAYTRTREGDHEHTDNGSVPPAVPGRKRAVEQPAVVAAGKRARGEAEAWLRSHGLFEPDPLGACVLRFPSLSMDDVAALETVVAELTDGEA